MMDTSEVISDSEANNVSYQYIGKIPVRNLWLLMFYASDLFRSNQCGKVSVEEQPDDIPDMVAEILVHAVEDRKRRKLNSVFQSRSAVLNRVRGKINILQTERHRLLERGLVACRFDELTIDTPRNRFVRFALEKISGIVRKKSLSIRCKHLANDMRLMGVTSQAPSRTQMSREQFNRNDSNDRLMLAAAILAIDLAIPTEDFGTNVLPLPDREERWVRKLFEKAVGGFFGVVLNKQDWSVRCGQKLDWQIESKTPLIDNILPSMQTDITLVDKRTNQLTVIDTKFTSILKTGRYRDLTLSSGYLYQIYAYLQSQTNHQKISNWNNANGVLLFPAVGTEVDESVSIQGHQIRFLTVDLTATAERIRTQLLNVCNIS